MSDLLFFKSTLPGLCRRAFSPPKEHLQSAGRSAVGHLAVPSSLSASDNVCERKHKQPGVLLSLGKASAVFFVHDRILLKYSIFPNVFECLPSCI